MTEVIPGLAGLKGGLKKNWIDNNLPFISMLNDNYGFAEACKMCGMKPGTMVKALQQAERESRPVVTLAQKAMSRVLLNEDKLHDISRQVNEHARVIEDHLADDHQLRQDLANYFGMLSQANALMQRLVMSHSTKPSVANFTEHIGIAPNRKVGPSRHKPSVRLFASVPGRTNYPARLRKPTRHLKPQKGAGGV